MLPLFLCLFFVFSGGGGAGAADVGRTTTTVNARTATGGGATAAAMRNRLARPAWVGSPLAIKVRALSGAAKTGVASPVAREV